MPMNVMNEEIQISRGTASPPLRVEGPGGRRAPTQKKARIQEALAWTGRLSLFFLSSLLAAAIMHFEMKEKVESREFVVDEPAPRTVFSSLELDYENKKLTQELREKASRAVFPVYRLQAAAAAGALSKAEGLWKGELLSPFSKPAAEFLKDPQNQEEVRRRLQILAPIFFEKGVFETELVRRFQQDGLSHLTLISQEGDGGVSLAVSGLQTPDQARAFLESQLAPEVSRNRNLKNALVEIFEAVKSVNTGFDEKETALRQKKAAELVSPVMAKIKKNELIVQRGMLITAEEKERIDQIQKALDKKKVFHSILAASALALLTHCLCFIYLLVFSKKTLFQGRSTLLILSVILLTLLISKCVLLWPGSSPYLMPTALAPLLLVLLMRPRLAFLGAFAMPLLIAPVVRFQAEVVLATLVSGYCAILGGMKIRKRIQFLQVGLAIGVSYSAVVLIYRVFQEYPLWPSFQMSAFGLANGVLMTVLFTILLVPLFEHFFHLMSDVTLLELSDLNHPLLKRMIVEAPGTYHHSLVVSALGEAACEAIGANALLARVGCYFHDIGKIAHAEFFTENAQGRHRSKHDELSPRMSSIIIMNHVKDGIELGRKHRLKEPILRFIPEHQGTAVVYYFYRKALDEAKAGEHVNPDDYRYPGPKPQSRETAVALLADSVEAASRSLKEPTFEGIRQLVRKIINDKFIDGQLEECDLTLKDLHKIQECFVRNLMAIFHTRVPYPAAPESPERPDLFKEDASAKER